MVIRILAVGGLKEPFVREGVQNYLDRLNRKWKVSIEELSEEKIPEKATAAQINQAVKRETENILKALKKQEKIILLDVEGAFLTTFQLRKKLMDWSDGGRTTITIIIGGSYGVDRETLQKKAYSLSFSKMTFPHQLMRLILLEQLGQVQDA